MVLPFADPLFDQTRLPKLTTSSPPPAVQVKAPRLTTDEIVVSTVVDREALMRIPLKAEVPNLYRPVPRFNFAVLNTVHADAAIIFSSAGPSALYYFKIN
jgi:hypothetical protein